MFLGKPSLAIALPSLGAACCASLLLGVPALNAASAPLYQAVALMRALALGTVGPASLLHAAYLGVMGAIGLVVAGRRIGQLLLS